MILGSGWAGYGFARTLDPSKYERVMISPRSYFVFTPLLAGTAVGTLEFRATLESVRRLGLDHFHQGWADNVDFARKTIRVEANTSDDLGTRTAERGGKGAMFDVPYDKLVVAVGAYSQTFNIEGVREHASFLRDVGDARRIRMKVLQNFERAALPTTSEPDRAKLLHFAIVGGGPTGIEFAAELHDLVRDDLARTYPDLIRHVGITVYDVAPKVLPMFDQALAAYAMDTFRREGIAVKTEHHLQRIRPDEDCPGCLRLKIKECGDEEVGAGIVVWSTGLMQNPLVSKLCSTEFAPGELGLSSNSSGGGLVRNSDTVTIQKDGRTGSIVTDAHLRVQVVLMGKSKTTTTATESATLPDVYTIGDCAVIPDSGLPATAQVASQQATYLAKKMNKGLDALSSDDNSNNSQVPRPFKFRNWGTMTYLGSWTAIHQSSADELKGWAAWVLWRTAYLTKSMSVRNKIMVPVYWVISWLFGRDISRF